MAFSTVAEAIAAALRLIQVPAPTSAEYTDAMQALNLFLEEQAMTPPGVYKATRENFNLTANVAEYTLGPSQTFNTVRPISIRKAFTRSSGVDYPINVYVSVDDYAEVELKTSSGRPEALYLERGTTNHTLVFYPRPDAAYEFHLWSYKPLTAYTSTSQSFGLGVEYEPFIKWNLALELCEEFGKIPTQVIVKRAEDSLQKIRTLNSGPVPSAITDPFGHSGVFDIVIGGEVDGGTL